VRTITIAPYDESWSHEFEKIKREIASALPDIFISIEHVGSTAIPGLFAKPIIDIDIVIDIQNFDKVKMKLANVGYFHIGDLGIQGREAFKYKNKCHLMEHHLCVCDKNADELKRHIALRDFLHNNKEYRDKYSYIKQEMAAKYPHDIDSYILGKQPVILEIYKKCGLDTTYKNTTGLITYRLATISDTKRLAELFWEQIEEEKPLNPDEKELFVCECAEYIKHRLGVDLYCWIAESDKHLIAHINVIVAQKIPRPGKIVRKWGRLSTVRTIPEYRNKGVGSALMEKVKSWSREQNLEELFVCPSERSVPFYERTGFKGENEVMEIYFG